ncbi:MAG: PAS domain-containing protein [Verrucomicrobiales bacterium]|nr:PAS domain-containing protein [Verrucomicrobiales bacterium]
MTFIGLFRLCDYLLRWNLEFDRLGFQETPDGGGIPTVTRMAPATAFSFLLLGCALLLATQRCFIGAFQFLTLLGGLIGWLGFSHYLYGGDALLPYAKMSVHTATAVLILSAGILCTRTDGGLMGLLISDSAGGVIARRLVPSALVIPIVLGWLRLEGQRAGWYGTEAGISLFALSNILVFGALIWANAARLHRTDSEREQAGRALRESQELLQSIINNSTTVVYVKDLAGRYLLVNRRFEELFHVTQTRVVGQTDYDLFPKEQADAFRTVDGQVSSSGKVVEAEEVAPPQ